MREHCQELVRAAVRGLQFFGLIAQFPLHFRQPKQRAHGGDELFLLERVAQVAIGAAFEALYLELRGEEHR